jgi:methylenetetrahydrofolate dehydrogenase (NADP+)/methenyltetrahydrofolate cyclohydrolase
MPGQLLDGNLLSKKIRAEIATRAAIVTAKGVRPAGFFTQINLR